MTDPRQATELRYMQWGDAFRQDMPKTSYLRKIDSLDVSSVQGFDTLEKLLRDVRLMGDKTVKIYEHAKIRSRKYKIANLTPIALYLLRPQLGLHAKIFEYLEEHYNQNLFGLTGVLDYTLNGVENRMVPPIIERFIEPTTGEEIAAIVDGYHRVYTARQLGFTEMWVTEISDFPKPLLPYALPVSWDDVTIYDEVPSTSKKRLYRYPTPADFPKEIASVTSEAVTQFNYMYFLYRDFANLGSSGVRLSKLAK